MKNMKLLISFVLVVIVCVMLAGCTDRPSSENEGWNDSGNPGNQEWTDPDKPGDQDWEDPSNPSDQNWPDPYNPSDHEWSDVDDPSETTEPSEPAQTGSYRHEVDGAVFYTEHSVDEWINGDVFYINDMFMDIFGNVGTYGGGIAGTEQGREVFYMITYEILKPDGNPTDIPTDTDFPHISLGAVRVYEYGSYGDLYIVHGWKRYIPYELLELALYACEQRVLGNSYAVNELSFVGHHLVVVN